MKTLVSIFLFLLLAFSIFLKLGTLINWKLNQDYIAKNLCINIDKPKMGCRGKCQLDKRLKKVDSETQQEKNPVHYKVKIASVDLFLAVKKIELSFPDPKMMPAVHLSQLTNHYCFCFLSQNIKPPISIA